MNISTNGIAFIKSFEGLRLQAYADSARVWTIGWGSTHYANGLAVKKSDKLLNRACADDLFLITLKDRVATVNRLIKVPITQNQFDALVSFEYNTGELAESSVLTLLNQDKYGTAADHLLLWNEDTDPATGKRVVCPDLTTRRAKERALFLKP